MNKNMVMMTDMEMDIRMRAAELTKDGNRRHTLYLKHRLFYPRNMYAEFWDTYFNSEEDLT